MNSMTGFGRGDAAGEGITWSVEVASVNRKQLEIVANLPRELSDLEVAVRAEVGGCCSRGRVTVQVRSSSATAAGTLLKVDESLALQYAAALKKLSESLNLPHLQASMDPMRWPGVIEREQSVLEAETAWPLIEKALRVALAQFVAMRRAEGDALKQDMEMRLAKLAEYLSGIEAKSSQVPDLHRKALMQRLESAGLPVDLSDERLIKEIALFADRCDISEEVTRARSHLAQFANYIGSKEAMGRNMDFLSQELFREFNTMGSKANNADLAHLVVSAKTEIERIREQVQNVE